MEWEFCETWHGVDIYEAFDAEGNSLGQFKIEGGETTTKEKARGQAYASSVALTPETPVKKTGGMRR